MGHFYLLSLKQGSRIDVIDSYRELALENDAIYAKAIRNLSQISLHLSLSNKNEAIYLVWIDSVFQKL